MSCVAEVIGGIMTAYDNSITSLIDPYTSVPALNSEPQNSEPKHARDTRVERDQKPAAWMLELPINFFDESDRLLIRIENLSQETFDLFVRFKGTDGMLDESLVEKVQA
jgi:hypothetical protein